MNRWLYQGFNAGQVRPAYAARPGTDECNFGVQAATNCRLTSEGSLTQAPGSELLAIAPGGSGSPQPRIFPYVVDNDEYIIMITADDEIPANQSGGIYLYEKVGGAWSSTPSTLWALPSSVPNVDPYVSFGTAGVNWGHPYSESDLEGLRHVQFEDKLFILSANHPPILIQREKNQLGGFEYWRVDYYPFRDGGGEIGSKNRGTTITVTDIAGGTTITTNGQTLTANKGIFNKRLADTSDTYTVSGLVDTFLLGAIYRVGDLKMNAIDENGYGGFFSVQNVVSDKVVETQTITPFTATTRDYSNPEQWAGPWLQTDDLVTIGAVPATGTGVRFSLPDAQVNLDPYDDLGCIIQNDEGGTKKFVLYIGYDPVGDQHNFVNIGNPISGSNWSGVPKWEIEDRRGFMMIEFDPAAPERARISSPDLEALPDGHEELYENLQWKGIDNTDLNVGGPVYVNGGIFRVDDREEWDNQGITELTGGWGGVWERAPLSAGPVSSWGWGPSKGAGFPDVGVVHQRRLVLGGYKRPGAALTISATGNPFDMEALRSSGLESGPLNFRISDARDERIRVLESFTTLFISTDYGEYQLEGLPLSSTSIGVSKVSQYGSRNAGKARVGSVILWATADGRGIRETKRDFNTTGFLSSDLLASSDVLDEGDTIAQIAQLGGAETQIFIRTTNNKLILLSHNEERGVKGFTKYGDTTRVDGRVHRFIDIMELRDDNAQRDQTIWALTDRGSDAGTPGEYFVERFDPDLIGRRRGFHTNVTATSIVNATNYALLETEVFIDGVYRGRFEGDITGTMDISSLGLSSPPTSVELAIPMDMNIGLHVIPFNTAEGPTAAKKFNIRLVNVFIEGSFGGKVEDKRVKFVDTTRNNTPFTGWVAVPGSGGSSGLNPEINITTEHPLRFKLAAVVLDGTKQTS